MSKREKIIVGLMVVALIFGAFNLIFTGKKKSGGAAMEQDRTSTLTVFVAEISAALRQDASKAEHGDAGLMAVRASEPWKKDPLLSPEETRLFEDQLKIQAERKNLSGARAALPDLVYTGFLSSGGQALAVINGLDYEVGDYLEMDGEYIIRSITPTQVVIAREATGERLVLPMEESE